MDPYVAAGYGVTLLTLAAYALRLVQRGRALSRTSPSSLTAPTDDGGRR